ncbi:MAG: transcriptional regulator [Enterococcus faecalis]|nr:transcriptional regulator [Enterococcus faecalis]
MRNLPIARLAIEKGCRKAHGHEGANWLHVNFFAEFGRSLKNEYYRTYLVNQRVFKGYVIMGVTQ